MIKHRYFSILFFLVSLSFSSFTKVLPMNASVQQVAQVAIEEMTRTLLPFNVDKPTIILLIKKLASAGITWPSIQEMAKTIKQRNDKQHVEKLVATITQAEKLTKEQVNELMNAPEQFGQGFSLSSIISAFASGISSSSNKTQNAINTAEQLGKRKTNSNTETTWNNKKTTNNQLSTTPKLQVAQPTALKTSLKDSGFGDNDLNQIPVEDLTYPVKALECMLGDSIGQITIAQDRPNVGLHNANGNDCFMSASLQVLSQLNPFINALENMDGRDDLQNEFLAFASSLRQDPTQLVNMVYKPAKNASAVFRYFLTQHRVNGPFIANYLQYGQQDPSAFISGLIGALTNMNINLSNIFSIKLVSTSTLTHDSYNILSEIDQNVVPSINVNAHEPMLQLPLTGNSVNECLNGFFTEENDIERTEWDMFGNERKIRELCQYNSVFTTKQLCLGKDNQNNLLPLPPILTIQLKRFSHNGIKGTSGTKLSDPVSFPLNLNVENANYRLVGIIVHGGNTINGGHYWAYTKDRFSTQWALFNDAWSTPVDEVDIQAIANNGVESEKLLNMGKLGAYRAQHPVPYMLFYERV